MGTAASKPRNAVLLLVAFMLAYRARKRLRPRPVQGDVVEACFNPGSMSWYPGKISKVHVNGTVDVIYDDGDVETHKPLSMVRFLRKPRFCPLRVRKFLLGLTGYFVGDLVTGNYRREGQYYKAIVTARNADGTYALMYNDGDSEAAVLPQHVQFREAETYYAKGRGQKYLDTFKGPAELACYFIECTNEANMDDMSLLLADNCTAELKEHVLTGKEEVLKACEKMVKKMKGIVNSPEPSAVTVVSGPPCVTRVKYSVYGFTVGDELEWQGRRIVKFKRGRKLPFLSQQ